MDALQLMQLQMALWYYSIVVGLVVWISCIFGVAHLAKKKGHNPVLWGFLGGVFQAGALIWILCCSEIPKETPSGYKIVT